MRKIPEFPLWLGNVIDLRDMRALHSAGIQAIVDLAGNEPPTVVSRELTYLRFPLIDGEGNAPTLMRMAIDNVCWLARSKTSTLICCSAGMSRSPAVAAMAIAQLRNQSANESLEYVRKAMRMDVSPVFWNELQRTVSAKQNE
jgi:hypothetical protein